MKRVKLTWKDGSVEYFNCIEEIGATSWFYDAIPGVDYTVEEVE